MTDNQFILNDHEVNYDADEFYEEVNNSMMRGATPKELPDLLSLKFGVDIEKTFFDNIRKGKIEEWGKEENERRSKRLNNTILRAQNQMNSIVRGVYLSTAIGKKKVKSTTTVTRKLRVNGVWTDDVEVQTSVTESEIAPNIGAMNTWLYHNDPDWRKITKGVEEDTDDVPKDIKKGVDIDAWIRREISMGDDEDELNDTM